MVRTTKPDHDRARRFRIPVFETLLVLGLLAIYTVVPLGANSTILWACLLAQYAVVLATVVRPIKVWPGLPTFVSAEFLFQFFCYLIFFYPYQLHVLGIYEVSRSAFFQNTFPDLSNQAIILSLIGTLSFRAGVRALVVRDADAPEAGSKPGRLDGVTSHALALPVFVLQVLLIAMYVVFGWRAAGEGRYSGQTAAGPLVEGVYLAIIVLSMIAVALWVLPTSEGAGRSAFISLAAVLSVVWASRLLVSGDRNAFLLIAIVGVGGIVTFRVRTGRWVLIALGIVALPMYNAIEALRSGRVSSVFEFFSTSGAAAASYGGDTSFNISTIGVRAALARVPETIDYGYGLYKLIGAAGVIPFIRGQIVSPDIAYLQSADVLNDILLGPRARWGVGSNVIVDVYVDLGVIAVPVMLFGLGIFVAFVQRAVTRLPGSPWRSVIYLMTLALIAEIPRYSLDFPVRPLVWTFLIFWAVSVLRNQETVSSQRSAPVRPSA
jgi:oligosaccharide repeat unit polymerase